MDTQPRTLSSIFASLSSRRGWLDCQTVSNTFLQLGRAKPRGMCYDGEVVPRIRDVKQIPGVESRLQSIGYPSIEEPDTNASAFIIP
jgi:hypothetical protein